MNYGFYRLSAFALGVASAAMSAMYIFLVFFGADIAHCSMETAGGMIGGLAVSASTFGACLAVLTGMFQTIGSSERPEGLAGVFVDAIFSLLMSIPLLFGYLNHKGHMTELMTQTAIIFGILTIADTIFNWIVPWARYLLAKHRGAPTT
jgi:hypothetical protein